jgi:hypothetical protein
VAPSELQYHLCTALLRVAVLLIALVGRYKWFSLLVTSSLPRQWLHFCSQMLACVGLCALTLKLYVLRSGRVQLRKCLPALFFAITMILTQCTVCSPCFGSEVLLTLMSLCISTPRPRCPRSKHRTLVHFISCTKTCKLVSRTNSLLVRLESNARQRRHHHARAIRRSLVHTVNPLAASSCIASMGHNIRQDYPSHEVHAVQCLPAKFSKPEPVVV